MIQIKVNLHLSEDFKLGQFIQEQSELNVYGSAPKTKNISFRIP